MATPDQFDLPDFLGHEAPRTLHVYDIIRHPVLGFDGEAVTYANPATAKLLRYSRPADLHGMPLEKILHPDYWPIAELGLHELAAEPGNTPLLMVDSDGTQIDVEMWVEDIGDGDTVGYLLEFQNVSGHLVAARALRERELRLEELLNTVSDGIVSLNGQGRIESFNAGAEEMFALPAHEAIGQHISCLLEPRSQIEVDDLPLKSVVTGKYSTKPADGEPIAVEVTVSETRANGEPVSSLVIRDISRQEQYQAELEKFAEDIDWSRSHLEQESEKIVRLAEDYAAEKARSELADRSKTEFLTNMSHELRTPLNTIIGFSEMLEGEFFGPLGSDKNRDYIGNIKTSGQHLLSLINDILDVSKIEAGEMEIYEETFNIADAITACATMTHERAAKSGVTIKTCMTDDLPPMTADVRMIKQIIINLISNAVKFTPEAGTVTVGARINAAGELELSCRDTGIGIDEADIPRVMEPFGQVQNSLTRNHKGTGLGLPLCKQLAELNDGSLRLESELGVGTTVTVIFAPQRLYQPAANAS